MATTLIENKTVTKVRQLPFLQVLGEALGIPIKVEPWGRLVRRKFLNSDKWYWDCPAGGADRNTIRRPEIKDGQIIIYEGQCKKRMVWGERNHHKHAQLIDVISIGEKEVLVRIRNGSNYTQYLIGMDDENPYAVPINRHLKTIEQVFAWLTPKPVEEAITQGLDVKRQGDWFFIPLKKPPIKSPNRTAVYGSAPALTTNTLYRGVFLICNGVQTRHRGGMVFYRTVTGFPGQVPVVKGKITALGHNFLILKDWHIGVRNKSTPWRNVSAGLRSD